jgi:hypothetical protein
METGMNTGDRIYRALLHAYPSSFRATFGGEMAIAFRDRRREMRAAPFRFWLIMLLDVARSAPAQRLEASTGRAAAHIQFKEGTMKTMAIVAVIVGLLEAASASIEAWIGGVVNHSRFSLAGGTMGMVAGLFLAVAAIAVLRRRPGSDVMLARAATACLAAFGAVWLLRPMLSIASTGLGIMFPIVLLFFLRTRRGGLVSA